MLDFLSMSTMWADYIRTHARFSVPDGKICVNDMGELAVTKFAVEPVWYLPGVAERFGIGMWSCRHNTTSLVCVCVC